jgi:hypothetical protein
VFVALVIQHAKRMCRVLLSSVACTALPHFSILSHKEHHSRENSIQHKMRVSIFFTYFTWNTSHSKNNSARYYLNVHRSSREVPLLYIGLHVKYPLFFSDFNETWSCSTHFRKISKLKFHENPSSGSRIISCGQTDRQTNRHDEANSRFSILRTRLKINYCKSKNAK